MTGVSHSLSFSPSSPQAALLLLSFLCHLPLSHFNSLLFFFFFWLLPWTERNAMHWKGLFAVAKSANLVSVCQLFFFFFLMQKPLFFPSFLLVCHCVMVIAYLFFFCQLSIQARNQVNQRAKRVEQRDIVGFDEILSSQELWVILRFDWGMGKPRSHYRKDRVRPSWIGLGREGLQGCWITSSWKSHMTGSHMLLSFVYTPHIAVQQQHVHTQSNKRSLRQCGFICVFV